MPVLFFSCSQLYFLTYDGSVTLSETVTNMDAGKKWKKCFIFLHRRKTFGYMNVFLVYQLPLNASWLTVLNCESTHRAGLQIWSPLTLYFKQKYTHNPQTTGPINTHSVHIRMWVNKKYDCSFNWQEKVVPYPYFKDHWLSSKTVTADTFGGTSTTPL